MFEPSLNKRGIINFKIKGIGEVNQDLLTGISGSKFAEASLFIDDAYDGYAVCWYYTLRAYNKGDDLKWFQNKVIDEKCLNDNCTDKRQTSDRYD